MNNHDPIILVGFMGTGKSTIASYLNEQKGYTIVDLDDFIVSNEKMSIPDIFKHYGESHFRTLEAKYLNQCLAHYDVIATGGGIVESEAAFHILQSQKHVIWLDCDIDVIYNRIHADTNRPNVQNRSLEELKNLYLSRISRYNEIAFIKLNSSQNIHSIFQKIMDALSCE